MMAILSGMKWYLCNFDVLFGHLYIFSREMSI